MGTNEPFTYEDIEKYSRVQYVGMSGWILDKGDHITKSDKKSILIQLDEPLERSEIKEIKISRARVNKYLRERRKLWIDFGDLFTGVGPENGADLHIPLHE